MSYQTPYSALLTAGNYRITMAVQIVEGSTQYNFSGWTDGDINNPRTVNLQTNASLMAQYVTSALPVTPLIQTLPLGGTYNVSVPASIVSGADTYRFKQWEDGSTNPTRQISLNQNLSLLATYELTTVTLNIIAGANGVVNPSGYQTLNVGQTYSFNAIPDTGYLLDHWDLDGANIGSSNPLSLTATVDLNNKLLTAIFTSIPPVQINLNVNITGKGVTTPSSGTQIFNVGDIIQFSAIPNTGFAFKQWTLNGTTYTENPLNLPITVDMAGKTLTAEFSSPTPLTSSMLLPALGLLAVVGIGYLATRKKRRVKWARSTSSLSNQRM